MCKNIFILAFLMLFMVAGVSFGGCASKQSNSTAQDSSKQPEKGAEKAPKPAPEGQSLYNSSSFTEEKASGYYSHGFSEAQLQKLQENEEASAEQ